jgi:2,3-bisphosphoglycerate-dependent phosphoglycerate mutase
MKILLIRHGETTGDVEHRYGGAYDDHLTETGRNQLQDTARKLAGRVVDVMYVSTLMRARESAEILNDVLHTRIEFLDGLQERDYGILGGVTKQEAIARFPDVVEAHKDPANTDPDGESQYDFTRRVVGTFESICANKESVVVLVSHGGPIKVILRHLAREVPDTIADGEVIEVEIDQ